MFVNKRGIAEVIARAFLNLVMLGLFGVAVYMMGSLGGKSSVSVLWPPLWWCRGCCSP